MGKKKKDTSKRYYFPCGEHVTLKQDAGHAYGVLVSQKLADADESTRHWGNDKCRKCTLNCRKVSRHNYINRDTNEQNAYEDTVCIAYSKEYLDHKDKPTIDYRDDYEQGEYLIEVIFQTEEFRAVQYFKGKNQNCGLLDLIDLEEAGFITYLDEDDPCSCCSMYMINVETGKVLSIDFDSLDDVMRSIVSVRFVRVEKEGRDNE